MVAREAIMYEMVIAIEFLKMNVLSLTVSNSCKTMKVSVDPDGVSRPKPSTKTLNQNFWNRGLSCTLMAIANMAVASPSVVPPLKKERTSPIPTAKRDM